MKVRGLETFGRYFSSFDECYCLIGGAALSLINEKQGVRSRSTKDLDVVVLLKGDTPLFVRKLISFVEEGAYQKASVSPNGCSYRFSETEKKEFPEEIELFTKEQDIGKSLQGNIQHLSLDAEVSFSSIVLDSVYYDYISANRKKDVITYIDDYAIVPLKAKAYLENKALYDQKTPNIHEDTYKKHARDIIRFVQDFPVKKIPLPDPIKADCHRFYPRLKPPHFRLKKSRGIPPTISLISFSCSRKTT
jgi:hypothetical protein